jgi:hypothetical protein
MYTNIQTDTPPVVRGGSPWGTIDGIEVMAEGILRVFTPSHGGIWLSPERRATLPAWAHTVNSTFCAKPRWWEEDCEAAVPLLAFYDDLRQEVRDRISYEKVREWAIAWHPGVRAALSDDSEFWREYTADEVAE